MKKVYAVLTYQEYLKTLKDKKNTKFKNEQAYNKVMGIEDDTNKNKKEQTTLKNKLSDDVKKNIVKEVGDKFKEHITKVVTDKVKENINQNKKNKTKNIRDGINYNNVSHKTLTKNMSINLSSIDNKKVKELKNTSKETVTKHNIRKFTDTLKHTTGSVLKKYEKGLSATTHKLLYEHVDNYISALKEGISDGSLKNISERDLDEFIRHDLKIQLHQEIETKRRSVGDHGIRHNSTNAKNAVTILTELQKGGVKVTGKDKLMALAIMANHDVGYTVGDAATSGAKGKTHKVNSGILVRQNREFFEKVFNKEDVDKMVGVVERDENGKEKLDEKGRPIEKVRGLIQHHDDMLLDWENAPLASAITLSDTTALFGQDKVQDLFIKSPKAMNLACKLRLAATTGDSELQDKIKQNLHKVVDEEKFNDVDKELLHHQIHEMVEGKFSTTVDILSRYSGRIEKFNYDKQNKVMNVNMKYTPEGQTVDMLFGDEVSAKQFNKFMGDMNAKTVDGKKGVTSVADDSGKNILNINIKGIDDKPIDSASNDAMKQFLKKTIRGQITQTVRKISGKKSIKPKEVAIDFKQMRNLFSDEEWKKFMSVFFENKNNPQKLAQILNSYPLLKKEMEYLKSKEARLARIASIINNVYIAERICANYKSIAGKIVLEDELNNLLDEFNIPNRRRDIENKSNLRWILRNIMVKNADNPKLELTVKLIKEKLKL